MKPRRLLTCAYLNVRLRLLIYICSCCLLLSLFQYFISVSIVSYKPPTEAKLWQRKEKERKNLNPILDQGVLDHSTVSIGTLWSDRGSISSPESRLQTKILVIDEMEVFTSMENSGTVLKSKISENRTNFNSNSTSEGIIKTDKFIPKQFDDFSVDHPVVKSDDQSPDQSSVRSADKSKDQSSMRSADQYKPSEKSSDQALEKSGISVLAHSSTDTVDNRTEACREIPSGLQGRLKVNKKVVDYGIIETENPSVQAGGRYRPAHCAARNKVAIIVPFRNREDQLKVFLRHIHPFLRRQEVQYGIYIINQAQGSPFNRATLINVGFLEANKDEEWQCFIFHDVDLLPEDDRNLYTCPQQPRHMSVSVDKFKYKLPYKSIFGGVTAIGVNQFRLLNGYSNEFWGWGGEDDDMSRRIHYHRLKIERYRPEIARYTMLRHRQEVVNKNRMKILKLGGRRYRTDGLANVKYDVLSVEKNPTYTNITVLLRQRKPLRGRRH